MRVIASVLKWLGFMTLAFGVIGSGWAIALFFQMQAGVSEISADYGRAALGGVLGSMFFVMVGAILILLSRPLEAARHEGPRRRPKWMIGLALLLVLHGVSAICLATILAGMSSEFGDATTGIVSYCMLVGVGLFIAAWGLKRASQVP